MADGPAPARRNVELKARDPDPAATLAAALALDGAEDRGTLRQRDTYFPVPTGGLKLRDEAPGRPSLVQWSRADAEQERESAYRIAEVADAAAARAALGAALGVHGEVEKSRRLVVWRRVRIHLDAVAGLGSFVELEAVAPPDSDLAHEHALVRELRAVLGISDDRLVPRGYADLLGLRT